MIPTFKSPADKFALDVLFEIVKVADVITAFIVELPEKNEVVLTTKFAPIVMLVVLTAVALTKGVYTPEEFAIKAAPTAKLDPLTTVVFIFRSADVILAVEVEFETCKIVLVWVVLTVELPTNIEVALTTTFAPAVYDAEFIVPV